MQFVKQDMQFKRMDIVILLPTTDRKGKVIIRLYNII